MAVGHRESARKGVSPSMEREEQTYGAAQVTLR